MRKIMTLVMGIVTNYLVAQQENVGYIVERNIETNVEYISYTPPLRINKVENQDEIDYSKIGYDKLLDLDNMVDEITIHFRWYKEMGGVLETWQKI